MRKGAEVGMMWGFGPRNTETSTTGKSQEMEPPLEPWKGCRPGGPFWVSFFLFVFTAAPAAYGSSQVRGESGAVAAGLHHSHGTPRSKLHLFPMSQLVALPDLQPTERGQGPNLHPHGLYWVVNPLSHKGNSPFWLSDDQVCSDKNLVLL